MDSLDLKHRTKLFAIDMIRFLRTLPENMVSGIIAKQLLRSGTSMAANYRAACRSRSKKEFYSKLSIVVEETDETMFWLEIMMETGLAEDDTSRNLYHRSSEFIKIFSKARKTLSQQLNQ